jgi:hypothetical protein
VFFQNMQMDSSAFGDSQVLVYGDECMLTPEMMPGVIADRMTFRLGDLPSRFLYPQWYISRKAHLELKKAT